MLLIVKTIVVKLCQFETTVLKLYSRGKDSPTFYRFLVLFLTVKWTFLSVINNKPLPSFLKKNKPFFIFIFFRSNAFFHYESPTFYPIMNIKPFSYYVNQISLSIVNSKPFSLFWISNLFLYYEQWSFLSFMNKETYKQQTFFFNYR